MKINVKVSDDTYFLKLLSILSSIPPFNKLRSRELETYAYLLEYNHRYRNIPFEERNKLIFDYDVKQSIATRMGVDIAAVRNYMSILRSHGVIGRDTMIPKYVLEKVGELVFVFKDVLDESE